MSYARRRIPFISRSTVYWALRDVSFDVFPGETLGIVGKNGSGKTTLLKVLAGIIEPDHGSIVRSSINVSMLSLQIGFLPHLSGRENAVLSGMLLGLTMAEARQRLPAIVEFAELDDYIDEPLATYSAGMRARLGFSVAYYAAPEALLIDEVLGVGDQEFRQKSYAAIEEIIRSNRTVVLVSHNLHTIRRLCDRVVLIDNGRTAAAGATEDVLADYT